MPSTEFRYGLYYRPASIGAIPKEGLIRIENPDPAAGIYARHGVVVYDRRLHASEVNAFGLATYLGNADVEHLRDAVTEALSEYRDEYVLFAAKDADYFRVAVLDQIRERYNYGAIIGNVKDFVESILNRLSEPVAFG